MGTVMSASADRYQDHLSMAVSVRDVPPADTVVHRLRPKPSCDKPCCWSAVLRARP